jgi:menaquinone-9 beta-reductase
MPPVGERERQRLSQINPFVRAIFTMQTCDVLIVGGGPAGSTLAWSLRKSGLAVSLMDRKSFPRDKVCAGWVTPEVMQELQIDPEAYGKERTVQAITGFRVGLLGQPALETHYAAPASYGIRRFEFDHFLLQRAGAHLLLNTEFKSMERNGAGWRVNGDVQARLVVGAGGHFCPVARAMGARVFGARQEGPEQLVAAQEIEFPLTPEQAEACQVRPEVPELLFTPDLNGYGWAFRKGNYLNIGLGREDNDRISDHVQAFRQYLIDTGRVPKDVPAKFKGHAYLLYPHARREVLEDGVLLIGDSAGLAYSESGEGIRPAVESGLLAGQVIAAANGDFRQENLRPYRDLLQARFGKRLPGPTLFDRVPLPIKRIAASLLMQNDWFVRKVMLESYFLHRHVPALPS